VLHLLRRDPHTCGLARSRWRLADVLKQLAGWRVRTCQGLGQVLARLGIVYKRGRDYIHSPDPDYEAKLAAVQQARQIAQADPVHQVLLYLDEMTLYRQPTVAQAWAARGGDQALARRSTRSDTRTRLLGALDAATGQVHRLRAETISVPTLVRFFRKVVAAYPEATTITVVLDNWSNHFHPDLLCALVPQQCPFPFLSPRQLGGCAQRQGPAPMGPLAPAHPTAAAANLRLLGQPHREAVAQAAPGPGPSPSLGRRVAPAARRGRCLAGRLPAPFA
jgi:DDE superfamily endonuclease